jgi:hypothetical protein
MMKRTALYVLLAGCPIAALGQVSGLSIPFAVAAAAPDPRSDGAAIASTVTEGSDGQMFSHVALGFAFSPLGAGIQAATNINDHLNLRVNGNFLGFSTSFATEGFSATGKLNLTSAGLSADFYPFRKGFRVSPGILVYNGNHLSIADSVAGGASFTLNNQTFYSANANSTTGVTPIGGTGRLNLNTTKPAFTITTGWGNMIPHKGWPISFPFEVGAAFIGAPSINAALNGWACSDQAQTECSNVSGNNPLASQLQGDLHAQLIKWTSDLQPLKTYPIISAGVAYSFSIHGGAR